MKLNRVVVTGIGMITPLGQNTAETWAAVKSGRVGVGPLTKVTEEDIKIKVAAEVKNYDPKDHFEVKAARRMDLVTQYGVVAAREAFRGSGLAESDFDRNRAGVIVSTGIGGLSTIERDHTAGMNRGFSRVSPFFIPMTIANITAGTIAMDLQLHGLCTCVVTACAASTNALGEAFHKIRYGLLDLAVAGGAEASITPLGVGGFSSMRALSVSEDPLRASIPFDLARDGFVMGEGAGALVLESLDHALARGADIYGEIVGYGSTCDAFHITAPDPEATQAARCFELCLADAGKMPEDVGYINAHGTSTPLNDALETLAIKKAFGEYAPKLKISSTKSMVGHMLGASGAVEAAVTLLALREQIIPPTAGLREADPACDLDYVPGQAVQADFDLAISNSLGFGGHNASLAMQRYD